jgi:mediator of RNA polymerase II transcription subunit 18
MLNNEVNRIQVNLPDDYDELVFNIHRFTRQMVQECYRFINGNVIFELSRYLQLPNEAQASDYNALLPPFETLIPFDEENKWILMISVRVANGKDPDQAQQAVSELMTTKAEFEGCFNFHMVARLTMDTRTKMT